MTIAAPKGFKREFSNTQREGCNSFSRTNRDSSVLIEIGVLSVWATGIVAEADNANRLRFPPPTTAATKQDKTSEPGEAMVHMAFSIRAPSHGAQ